MKHFIVFFTRTFGCTAAFRVLLLDALALALHYLWPWPWLGVLALTFLALLISLLSAKNYNCAFEFVEVMYKILLVSFPDTVYLFI